MHSSPAFPSCLLVVALAACTAASPANQWQDAAAPEGDVQDAAAAGRQSDTSTGADSAPLDGAPPAVEALLENVEGDCPADGALSRYTVSVLGEDLDGLEGATVHGYTEMWLAGGGKCGHRGQALVVDGQLALSMHSLTDGAAYPIVAAWVDLDEDGVCEVKEDLVYRSTWTALTFAEQTLQRRDFDESFERESGCEFFPGEQ